MTPKKVEKIEGEVKEKPVAKASKEKPIAKVSKEKPVAKVSKEKPVAKVSKEEPTKNAPKVEKKEVPVSEEVADLNARGQNRKKRSQNQKTCTRSTNMGGI